MNAQHIRPEIAIPKILDSYRSSIMAGDPDQWISNWTEDCVQLPPGGKMRVGKQNLYEGIAAWLEFHTVSEFIMWDLRIEEMGDWALSLVQYSYHLKPKDAAQNIFIRGKL